MVDDPVRMSPEGYLTVPVGAMLAHMRHLTEQLPPMPVVWCYDELQALLTDASFNDLFKGTFDPSRFPSFPPGAPATVPADAAAAAVIPSPEVGAAAAAASAGRPSVDSLPSLYAHPDDTRACAAALYRECDRGWFYGLLVALRHLSHNFPWGHLLCGSSLRLTRELFLAHSPAQGMCDTVDADVRLDAVTIRAWFEAHLTPEARTGLDETAIAKLVGRPLFASAFFERLHVSLRRSSTEGGPAAVVASALWDAVTDQTAKAAKRILELWTTTFPTASGEQPHTLVAWLYYLQRMGWGTATRITPPTTSSEVMDAVQRGVLHLEHDAMSINLADEPITAEAIQAVGDRGNEEWCDFVYWRVLNALARRVTSAFGDPSSKGATAEDALAWSLLWRAGAKGGTTLQSLFAPFIDCDLFAPLGLDAYAVKLHRGLHCGIALGANAARRCFLDVLEAPGGGELLLHHTQEKAAGADLAFLVQRPGEGDGVARRQRLVLVQVKNAAKTTAAEMLRSLDLGSWYHDATGRAETPSHAAFRELMARHPDWADPIRVLVSARPWSRSACQAAVEVSQRLPQQPVLLAQLTKEALGIDI